MLLEKDIGIGNMLVARLKDQRVQKVGDLTSIITCFWMYGVLRKWLAVCDNKKKKHFDK